MTAITILGLTKLQYKWMVEFLRFFEEIDIGDVPEMSEAHIQWFRSAIHEMNKRAIKVPSHQTLLSVGI